MACNYINTINSSDCLYNSLNTLNTNFSSLDVGIQNAFSMFDTLTGQFGTFVPGLTSIDKSIQYFARFTEAYNPLTSKNLAPSNRIIDRLLNHVDYNCDVNGNYTSLSKGSNVYYTLNSDGSVTIPPGIYDIDAEASMRGTEAHLANLVYVTAANKGIPTTPADVLFHGSAEYTEQVGLWPAVWGKMRGRATFTATTTIKIRHYNACNGFPVVYGKTFADYGVTTDTTNFFGSNPLVYFAFLNIQKIKDISA